MSTSYPMTAGMMLRVGMLISYPNIGEGLARWRGTHVVLRDVLVAMVGYDNMLPVLTPWGIENIVQLAGAVVVSDTVDACDIL